MATPRKELTLSELAAGQGGVVTWAQLRDRLGSAALRRAVRAGAWGTVVRGAYAEGALVEAARSDPALQHRLECAARVLLSGRDLVVSHQSAAVLQEMALLEAYTGPPQLTLPRAPGAPPAKLSGLLAAGLPPGHRELLLDVPVTTGPRTFADLARTLPSPAAVVMADAALRAGTDAAAVQRVLQTCVGWPGADLAEQVLAFADRRAESALESLARWWFAQAGLPAPDLQVSLCHAADGRFVARVDFLWRQQRTVCEVDGRLKYQDARRDDVLWQEKLREDTMRDLGLEVVRGYWSDTKDEGRSLADRLRRAFARAALRSDPSTYGILTKR